MNKFMILFFINILVSCSVGEEYKSSDFLSTDNVKNTLKISDNNNSSINYNWFEIFNDNDLNTLLKTALNDNFSIKQGIERLKQSRYQLNIQSKQFYPKINSENDYSFSKTNNDKNRVSNINNFKVGFDFSWEIDIWGKSENITEQYLQILKSSQYSLLNIKTVLTAELILNYLELRTAQEKLRITNKNLKIQDDILKSIKDKYLSGAETLLALNQAEFVVEKTKQLIPEYNLEIENYKNAIAVLLGVLPQNLPININNSNNKIIAKPFKYSVQELYELPLNVIHSRPDILSIEANIRKQNAIINQAIAELYPSINLDMALNFVNSSGRNLFNSNSQVYSYSPTIGVPIWNWNQLKNNVELQKSVKEEYLLNYNEALLTALLDLKNAITSVEQAYKTNSHTLKALEKMKNILTLTKNKFDAGLIEFTDLAQAEQDLLDAQLNAVESNATIIKNITAFYKATGGGYNMK